MNTIYDVSRRTIEISQFRANCYLKVHNLHSNLALPIWDKLSRDTINFSTVAVHCRDPPKTVFDQTLAHIYHKGDIATFTTRVISLSWRY